MSLAVLSHVFLRNKCDFRIFRYRMEASGPRSPMHKTLYTREYLQMVKLLQARRTSAKVSQVELARRLDWTQADISKCETGVRRLDVVELKLWLEALGSDLAGFVEELYGSAYES